MDPILDSASGAPVAAATPAPTETPTEAPTATPVADATPAPVEVPTEAPTVAPVIEATPAPTEAPVVQPTDAPTEAPTEAPATEAPVVAPVEQPTEAPTEQPTEAPTQEATPVPVDDTVTADYLNVWTGGNGVEDTAVADNEEAADETAGDTDDDDVSIITDEHIQQIGVTVTDEGDIDTYALKITIPTTGIPFDAGDIEVTVKINKKG